MLGSDDSTEKEIDRSFTQTKKKQKRKQKGKRKEKKKRKPRKEKIARIDISVDHRRIARQWPVGINIISLRSTLISSFVSFDLNGLTLCLISSPSPIEMAMHILHGADRRCFLVHWLDILRCNAMQRCSCHMCVCLTGEMCIILPLFLFFFSFSFTHLVTCHFTDSPNWLTKLLFPPALSNVERLVSPM